MSTLKGTMASSSSLSLLAMLMLVGALVSVISCHDQVYVLLDTKLNEMKSGRSMDQSTQIDIEEEEEESKYKDNGRSRCRHKFGGDC